MIDQATIDRIFEAAKIDEVVSDYVSLKKRGVNYIGLCPFHNEKTPSFIVSPAKGICKCFGCGKGGNSVNFIMEVEQASYVDALRQLAKKYHIEIVEKEQTPEQIQERNDRESMLIVNEFAAKYFSETMQQTNEGKAVGLGYFMERGFQEHIIDKFQLGYSPEKRDALTKEAIQKGYKTTYLVKTGLTVQGENYQADRFRGRVMFPIHNLTGKVVGFGGRILKTDAKTAKYLNSPESEIYHKSNVLYGIYHAKRSIVQEDRCFLVEGYTDVLSMHQAGIENVVASSGTALTPDQIRLIKRFTNNITVLYDGDAAGIKASLRGTDLILEQGLNVRILLLPDGEDPDSFAKKHSASELKTYIEENNSDFIKFKTKLLLNEAQNDPVKKAALVTDIVRSIAIIPDQIVRQVYAKECSLLMDIDEQVIHSEIAKQKRSQQDQQVKDAQRNNRFQTNAPVSQVSQTTSTIVKSGSKFSIEERTLIKYLIKYGEYKIFTDEDPEFESHPDYTVSSLILDGLGQDGITFTTEIYQRILDEYASHKKEDFQPDVFFTRHPDPDITRVITDVLTEPYEISQLHMQDARFQLEDKRLKSDVPKVLMQYKEKIVKQRVNELRTQLAHCTNDEEMLTIMANIQQYNQIMRDLNKAIGGRIVIPK